MVNKTVAHRILETIRFPAALAGKENAVDGMVDDVIESVPAAVGLRVIHIGVVTASNDFDAVFAVFLEAAEAVDIVVEVCAVDGQRLFLLEKLQRADIIVHQLAFH